VERPYFPSIISISTRDKPTHAYAAGTQSKRKPGYMEKPVSDRVFLCGLALSSFMTGAACADAPKDTAPSNAAMQAPHAENWFQAQLRQFRTYPHLDRAHKLINLNKLNEAAGELEAVLSLDPSDVQAHLTYMSVLYRLQKFDEVVQQANLILQQHSDTPRAYLYRGLASQAKERAADALADYQNVMQSGTASKMDRIFAASTAADLALADKRYVDALAPLAFLEKFQSDFSIYFRRGRALEALNRFDGASNAYQAALKYAKNADERLRGLNALGFLDYRQGHIADAIAHGQAVLEQEPNNLIWLRTLGQLYFQQKNYELAAQAGSRALSIGARAQDRLFLANVLFEKKDFAKAVEQYAQLAHQSDDAALRYRAYMGMGYAYSSMSNFESGYDAFRQAIRIQPDKEALNALAAVESQQRKPATEQQAERPEPLKKNAGGQVASGREPKKTHIAFDDTPKPDLPDEIKQQRFMECAYRSIAEGRDLEAIDAFNHAIATGLNDAHTRLDLGFAYARLKQWPQALAQFLAALEQETAPLTLMYVARSYVGMGQQEMATSYFEMASLESGKLSPEDQRSLYIEMGQLYSSQKNFQKAFDVWSKAAALQAEPNTLLNMAYAEEMLHHPDAALAIVQQIDDAVLERTVKVRYLEQLFRLYEQQENIASARKYLQDAATLEPNAERYYRLGMLDLKEANPEAAIADLKTALSYDPANNDYAEQLGYVYKAQGDYDQALRLFETIVTRDPERTRLYEDLAYTYKQNGNNDEAIEWFKKAIIRKNTSLRSYLQQPVGNDDEVLRMRREVRDLSKRFQFNAYQSYRTKTDTPTSVTAPTFGAGGLIPSQGGMELIYQPPNIGYQDGKVFQLFTRLLWSSQPDSLRIDGDTTQAGIGARYKPLKEQDFFVSLENLIKIGSQSQDDWLVRGSYGYNDGYDLKPNQSSWNQTLLYTDVGYFFKNGGTSAIYAELRQGKTFNFNNEVMVTPHVTMAGRAQHPDPAKYSYLEGGIGVAVKYLFNESYFEAKRSSVEFLVQYKRGIAPSKSGGWVFTAALQF
jgi:tetratricopeptide (TPR) repeat protein